MWVTPMTYAKVIAVTADVAWDVTLLTWGAYAPLQHLMTGEEYHSVCETMRLPNGTIFPLPMVLPVPASVAEAVHPGEDLEMVGRYGFAGQIKVTEIFKRDLLDEAATVYLTTDIRHPGVAHLLSQSPWCLAGDIKVLHPPDLPFREPVHPDQVKALIRKYQWRTIAAFQTRNPIHRAHEYLHKVALEVCDGLLLHPLIGSTKRDDIPAAIRMASYHILLDAYYPKHRVILATFPAAMRYAGPREALFHAIVRKNYGATHFIIGRDAAGVGDFYGPYDAIHLLEQHAQELGLTPLAFPAVGFCPRCQQTVSERTCPHRSEWFTLSGTQVRETLRAGQNLPAEFSRPEVSHYLQRALSTIAQEAEG
ncbi:sulfate adenylyltransferase [Sulfobacillus thermotolerans]|uniref:sulfate adenylyltransferase n=1 Tax=Sulfobacillus thermotolerans TaxID=338644 RepID=A0ABM6RRF6_9FIRM|nr:sulfate adenylyltransferase [Sulfobacillus thermotolerans]